MEKFSGFSQDEINKISGVKHKKSSSTVQTVDGMKQTLSREHSGIRRMPDKTDNMRRQVQRKSTGAGVERPKKSSPMTARKDKDVDSVGELNPDCSMSKSLEEALFYKPLKKTEDAVARTEDCIKTNGDVTDDTNGSSILKLPANMNSEVSSTSANSLDDSSILKRSTNLVTTSTTFVPPNSLNVESPFKGISLKDFEAHRKMIEEQNKQRKEMLYKAIEHHSQKTAAEARKIEEIKSELSKLDNDLAVDVALLRKQIDNACIQFANIEKHYMKIEAQFLKAKLDLHKAAEKKELLTEHLCTVIAHNEDRKAQKLSELMEKVGLTNCAEYEPPATPPSKQ